MTLISLPVGSVVVAIQGATHLVVAYEQSPFVMPGCPQDLTAFITKLVELNSVLVSKVNLVDSVQTRITSTFHFYSSSQGWSFPSCGLTIFSQLLSCHLLPEFLHGLLVS